MAFLKDALEPEEAKKITHANLKKAYISLAQDYTKIVNLDFIYCHCCGTFKSKDNFYKSKTNKSGYFHMCKKCAIEAACDYDLNTKTYKDNRDKTIEVLRMMDRPFIDGVYTSIRSNIENNVEERRVETAWSRYVTAINSLPQYKNDTFKNSDFGMHQADHVHEDNDEEIKKMIQDGRKRFGSYPPEDLYFLEKEYEDWVTRYPCDNKAQEELFKRVCFKQLEIDKATKGGRETKDLDKSLQDLLGSLGIKPNQNSTDSLVNQLSFDQLIDKWEDSKPIPEPEGEFKDIDKIGMLIDVFFTGHLSKMMGIKNAFSSIYEKFMAKYTVTKPQYEEGTDTESLFNKIFGAEADKEMSS